MIYSTLIKYGLMALALVALTTAIFAFGYSHGSTSGYTKGWNVQQATINKMVATENAQRVAQNKAISDLEVKAMQAQSDIFAAKAQAALTRNTIVTQYKTKYVQVAESCGWSAPTVQAINQLLSVGAAPQVPAVSSTRVSQ